jgi:hypothetical protein
MLDEVQLFAQQPFTELPFASLNCESKLKEVFYVSAPWL